MKKIVLIVVAVVLAAWLATTWFVGGGVEKGLTDFYENAEQRMGGGGSSPVTFEVGDISRGLFSSTAETKMSLADLPIEGFSATIKSKIYHGPLMFTAGGIQIGASYAISTIDTSDLPDEAQKLMEKGFDGEEPLSMSVKTGFTGSQDVTAKVSSFRHTMEEMDGSKSKIMFAGMSAEGHGSTKPDSPFTGTMKLGEFRISNDAKQTSFSTAVGTGEIDITEVQDGMTVAGTSNMLIPEIKATAPTGEYSVKDVAFKSESNVDPSTNSMGGFARMEFGSASGTDNTGMAEGLIVQLSNGGYFEVVLDGWNIDALKAFGEAESKMSKIQGEMTAAMLGEGDAEIDMEKTMEDMQAATSEVFDAALALFKPGMMLELRMNLGDGEGRSDIKIGIGYADGATPAGDAKTIGEFVDGLTADVDVRLSKAMLPEGMGEAMLAAPVQQGMIEDRGAYYRGMAEMRNKKISVNGNELPLLDQFAPMFEQELSMEGLMGAFMGGMGGGPGGPGGPDMSPDAGGFPAPDAPAPVPAPAPDAPAPDAPKPQE